MRRALAVAALLLGLAPVVSWAARDTFTINPVMSRGPADAPVTVVEFSDYQ